MVVIVLESVPEGLRGELSRWLVEPHSGVFVGRISAAVRELLWSMCLEKAKGGSGVLIHSSNSVMGYNLVRFGLGRRILTDLEGIQLVKFLNSKED